jgi:glc operon protein GlcG
MPSNKAEIAVQAPPTSNPLDVIPAEIPFDVPYGRPISLYQAEPVIHAAVAEARKRDWKMNIGGWPVQAPLERGLSAASAS